MKIKQKHLIIAGIVAIAIVAIYFIGSYLTGQYVAVGSYDDLAKCLTEKGTVMYGSDGCSACAEQKRLFGDSFQYVTYVKCPEQINLCREKGIERVPSWEIDGKIYIGVKTPETLVTMAGCPLE